MSRLQIDIFRYTDFRAFVKDALQSLKDTDAKFSHRFLMQRLGVNSSGWLADMLGGRRKLNRNQLLGLSQIFALAAREELYFETLVDYNQAKNLPEKNRAYDKLLTFHEIPKDVIDHDRFEYFSKWYYAAVREFLLIEPFRGDYARLARRIVPHITPAQARDAIELLLRLEMVKRYASGEIKPAVEHVKKQAVPSAFAPVHYYQYLKANMELGMGAMERIAKEERDISALSITLSAEAFQQMREELRAIRQKMIQISETENRKFWDSVQGDSRRVYQAVFELFPVSTTRQEAK